MPQAATGTTLLRIEPSDLPQTETCRFLSVLLTCCCLLLPLFSSLLLFSPPPLLPFHPLLSPSLHRSKVSCYSTGQPGIYRRNWWNPAPAYFGTPQNIIRPRGCRTLIRGHSASSPRHSSISRFRPAEHCQSHNPAFRFDWLRHDADEIIGPCRGPKPALIRAG